MAAGFNAPISGVFFAVESVLQRGPRDSDMEARNSSGLTVAMVLLASVVAAIVSQAGLGDSPAFRVPPYQLQSLWELPLVLLLGSTCGLVSVGFSYCSEVGAAGLCTQTCDPVMHTATPTVHHVGSQIAMRLAPFVTIHTECLVAANVGPDEV